MPDPIRPTDDQARALARDLLLGARFAALAVLLPDGRPALSRVGFGMAGDSLATLVSRLSQHTQAMLERPDVAVMVGEPGPRGDPLTHPRLSLQARASAVAPDDPGRPAMARDWLTTHPKARLYLDFSDFLFMRLTVTQAFLNGGFGQAFRLTPADLGLPD